MAEQQSVPLQLQWGRNPAGAFAIATVLPLMLPNGQAATVPVTTWTLTPEEEERLVNALLGASLVTASVVPEKLALIAKNGKH